MGIEGIRTNEKKKEVGNKISPTKIEGGMMGWTLRSMWAHISR